MKQSRRLFIEDKVISKVNLKYIANIFFKENAYSEKGNKLETTQVTINCVDNSTYQSNSINIIEDNGIIDIKKILSIEFYFYDDLIKKRIFFFITEGNGNSYVQISGDDSDWVNNLFTIFTEYINSIKPPDNWVLKNKKVLRQIIALGIGKIILFVSYFIFSLFIQPDEYPTVGVLAIRGFLDNNELIKIILFEWLVPWLCGLTWTPLIFLSISKFWPKIEFDFGPEHLKSFKIRRKNANIFISLVIIPSILMIIYDVAKYVLNK